jgi:hypothetical protein
MERYYTTKLQHLERNGQKNNQDEVKRETSKGHCVPSLNFPVKYGRVKTLHIINGLFGGRAENLHIVFCDLIVGFSEHEIG